MMAEQIQIKLIGYSVDKMSFILNKSFKMEPNHRIQVKPHFNRDITKRDQHSFILTLSISFDDYKEDIPFYLDVQISGVFNVENWENEPALTVSKLNGTAILFPYLRSLVTTITANANVPPYILPITNPAKLFQDK